MQFSRRVPKKSSLKKQLSKKYKQMVKATIQKLKAYKEKNSGKKFENKTIIMHKNPFSKEALIIIIKANIKIIKETQLEPKHASENKCYWRSPK